MNLPYNQHNHTHELKILPKHFEEVLYGAKKFEIRKDDRGFCVGDKLVLKEWENGSYTGREIYATILHILCAEDFPEGLKGGYCILSILVNDYNC